MGISHQVSKTYVHVALQTETARMENIRAESYFVHMMVIPRSHTLKNQKTPTNQNQNKQTKNPSQKHTKEKENNHSRKVCSTSNWDFEVI